MTKTAIIIGAGPAGLTAAFELLERTDIIPIVLEKSEHIGGISRTIDYKGNRMDMGPHRFFSKSDRVMEWWLKMFPLQDTDKKEQLTVHYQNKSRTVGAGKQNVPGDPDKVMLVIRRLTRIYFLRKFFAYPLQLSIGMLRTLGLIRTIEILFSFLWVRLFPRKPQKSLEDFIINKFGKQLYLLFFKDYTEKVWGVPCHEISAEWGAQRIKGVSLSKAIAQAVKSLGKSKGRAIGQREVETSLIEQFLYPKKGPGSLWEEVARQVQERGGKVYLNQDVTLIRQAEGAIEAVTTVDSVNGEVRTWEGDIFFSTMPVQELIAGLDGSVPEEVREIAAGLQYRDFINVGILLKQLCARNKQGIYEKLELKDNWIYIQERDVKVGRLMIYNNWGDGMIKDPNATWIGMEYFCNKTDAFWGLDDEAIKQTAMLELEEMELARPEDVLDATVKRMEKTYPAYFGTYDRFKVVQGFTDKFANLFLVGRNGMHKYNNADHSMLTAMVAVDNIVAGETSKANLWAINTEQEYHEEKPKPEALQQEQTAKRPSPIPGVHQPSFADYIWRNKANRAYMLFALVAFVMQFILFKVRYPIANYMPDSYGYLEAAYSNADVNMWPVAYSKFLRLISVFTHSDKVVVGIQYLCIQSSGLVFLFTLLYFLKPGVLVKNLLYAFFLFNPVALYMSNYISADALFIGLSFLWLSSLLWVIFLPQLWQILVQAVLLMACFMMRYNAIYYPLITLLAFVLSRQAWHRKMIGVGLGVILVSGSILYTSNKMEEVTGKRQFSAFGGWQLANNALYMYEHISPEKRGTIPQEFGELERMVRQHMDTLNKVKLSHQDSLTTYFYLWSSKGPLIQYMNRKWAKDSTASYFKKWASEGPLYSAYGYYLIHKYPIEFLKSFLALNALKYVAPPLEFLSVYNMGDDSVGRLAKDWFQYTSQKVMEKNDRKRYIQTISWYPIFAAIVNVLLFVGICAKVIVKVYSKNNLKILFFVLAYWLLNFMFSVLASPIVLRYQIISTVINTSIGVILIESVYKRLQIEYHTTSTVESKKR